MKFLHTADLHLGKTLHEVSLEAQQSNMLENIIEILSNDDYAGLIIAGDIYDRSMPSATSVTLFSNFLAKIKQKFPLLHVFIIPGNHDSALRLSYAHKLLKNMSVYIANDVSQISTPISISHDNENVDLFLLPFLQTGVFSIKTKEGNNKLMTSQKEMVQEAIERIKPNISKDVPSILVAHLFTVNGVSSSTERQFIGTAELVAPEILSEFTYVALGHLHRFQKITDRIYYSGSPLPYAFDEATYEKYVLSIEIDCSNANALPVITPIIIKPLIRLRSIEGKFHDLLDANKFNEYKNDYLEIVLKDEVSIQSPMQILQKKFPNLMTLRQESFIKQIDNNIQTEIDQSISSNLNMLDSFVNFSKAIGTDFTEDEKQLFISIYKELLNEA